QLGWRLLVPITNGDSEDGRGFKRLSVSISLGCTDSVHPGWHQDAEDRLKITLRVYLHLCRSILVGEIQAHHLTGRCCAKAAAIDDQVVSLKDGGCGASYHTSHELNVWTVLLRQLRLQWRQIDRSKLGDLVITGKFTEAGDDRSQMPLLDQYPPDDCSPLQYL